MLETSKGKRMEQLLGCGATRAELAERVWCVEDELRKWQACADTLKAENAELLELVRAAWKCIHSGLSCSDCRMVAGGCTLKSAMRKRGIGVDE